MLIPNPKWMHHSIEWSPNISKLVSQLSSSISCSLPHFVLPDLPNIYSETDREEFRKTIPIEKRIQTLAVCHHTEDSLKNIRFEAGKLLIVGGHDKHKTGVKCSMSTTDAFSILLHNYSKTNNHVDLWGVINPNDRKSLESLEEKIDSGMTGFITQPFLSAEAFDIFDLYPKGQVTYIAGVAMPKTVKNLHFWLRLLEQQEELSSDPLFGSHVNFFERLDCDSLEWIKKELLKLETHTCIDGVHFMPMENVGDLFALFDKKTHSEIK